MNRYFITSTGTNVGKTLVTSALCMAREDISAVKPVISGYKEGIHSDLDELCYGQCIESSSESHKEISLYRFEPPLSPDMIIRKYGVGLDYNSVLEFIRTRKAKSTMLVEGVGGIMAPIDDRHTNIDLIRSLDIPAIMVCGSYLGSISHSLTAYNTAITYGVDVKALVVSQNLTEDHGLYIDIDDTVKSLSNFIGKNIIKLKNINGSWNERINLAAQELKGLADEL